MKPVNKAVLGTEHQQPQTNVIVLCQKLADIFQQRFTNAVDELQNWLSLQSLLNHYQSEAASALSYENFRRWETGSFQKSLEQRIQIIERWVSEACEAFNYHQNDSLSISFPPDPEVKMPYKFTSLDFFQQIENFFTDGGVERKKQADYERRVKQAYQNAAQDYLEHFSWGALSKLNEYQLNVKPNLEFPIPPELPEIIKKRQELKQLNQIIKELRGFVRNLTILEANEKPMGFWFRLKILMKFYLYFISGIIFPRRLA